MATATATTLQPISADELEQLFCPAQVGDGTIALAKKARKQLGYSVLAEKVERESVIPQEHRDLLAILREHDVPLYRGEDVTRYKREKVTSVMDPLRQRVKLWIWVFMVLLTAVIVAGIAAIVIPTTAALIVLGVCIAAWVVSLIRASVSVDRKSRTRAQWNAIPLANYSREIPLPVLELATCLRKRTKNLKVTIEEFTVLKEPHDPLCFVELGKARFCIGVWDEPGFDAELIHR